MALLDASYFALDLKHIQAGIGAEAGFSAVEKLKQLVDVLNRCKFRFFCFSQDESLTSARPSFFIIYLYQTNYLSAALRYHLTYPDLSILPEDDRILSLTFGQNLAIIRMVILSYKI